MKKKSLKKLRLSRETVRALDNQDAAQIAGGTIGTDDVTSCWTCPRIICATGFC